MYKRPIIPAGFTPPARVDGPGFHLRMLTIHDAVKDFDAVMAAADRLKGFMEPGATWPDGLTLQENLIDLAWHQREFTVGHSFAYTVMNDDESRCLGCGYINPVDQPAPRAADRPADQSADGATDWPGYDAVALYWARDAAHDASLGQVFRALVTRFPFARVAFPGRDQPWPTT